jgi:hypothetical protein
MADGYGEVKLALLATIRTRVNGIKLRHIYTTSYTILLSPELGYIFKKRNVLNTGGKK